MELQGARQVGALAAVGSHTSELRNFPEKKSYVAEAERAISAAGHVIVDMADFPAAGQPAAQMCAEEVRGCDVYVGILGTRYGSPVRDRLEVSYTELEFDAATAAGLPRLMFLLDTASSSARLAATKPYPAASPATPEGRVPWTRRGPSARSALDPRS